MDFPPAARVEGGLTEGAFNPAGPRRTSSESHLPVMGRHPLPKSVVSLRRVVDWYSSNPVTSAVPFYCDPAKVGSFAVSPQRLAAGDDSAVFRLFITLSMYQALRDVVIQKRQRALPPSAVRTVADLGFLKRSIARHRCPAFLNRDRFEQTCDVWKKGGIIDCSRCPGVRCHVKDATAAFNRVGDMGKLPTSAFFRVWSNGELTSTLRTLRQDHASPTERASALVDLFSRVHRVGRKLATLFVSALSTPALAPGLSPWFPEISGNDLVVVDTNVARAVDRLRGRTGIRTYRSTRGMASAAGRVRGFPGSAPKHTRPFPQAPSGSPLCLLFQVESRSVRGQVREEEIPLPCVCQRDLSVRHVFLMRVGRPFCASSNVSRLVARTLASPSWLRFPGPSARPLVPSYARQSCESRHGAVPERRPRNGRPRRSGPLWVSRVNRG